MNENPETAADASFPGTPISRLASSEPDLEFQDGFTIRTMIGAVFVGFVMMPGTIYLGLVAGTGLGPAAQWVTIILFTEIARRSFTVLKRQEVYILYYMAAALAMTGGPFGGMIFNQYLVQSPQAIGFGIADQLPEWMVPLRTSPAITGRNLFHAAWYIPIALTTFLWIMGRANALTTGYMLFRITSDVEKLPFPLAPIAAEGATALAETTTKQETWRWNVFSVGAALGLAFGAIYVGVPGFTGVLFSKPLQIIPIPFVDLTESAHHVLPAALAGISLDLGAFIFGMVLPFSMVAGTFIAAVASAFIANPILQHYGMLPHWKPGMSLIPTKLSVDFDFWMSVGIGASLCVAFIGVYKVFEALIMRRNEPGQKSLLEAPKGRGDIKLRWCILVYVIASACSIMLCKVLLKQDHFPTIMILAYAPVHNARDLICVRPDDRLDRQPRRLPVPARGQPDPLGLPRRRYLVCALAPGRLRAYHPDVPRTHADPHKVHQPCQSRTVHAAHMPRVQSDFLGLFLAHRIHPLRHLSFHRQDVAAPGHLPMPVHDRHHGRQ